MSHQPESRDSLFRENRMSVGLGADDLAQGDIAEVTLQDADPVSLAIWAVLPARHHMPAHVRCFIEELRASLAHS